jgi:hypothetical protein
MTLLLQPCASISNSSIVTNIAGQQQNKQSTLIYKLGSGAGSSMNAATSPMRDSWLQPFRS